VRIAGDLIEREISRAFGFVAYYKYFDAAMSANHKHAPRSNDMGFHFTAEFGMAME